MAEEMGSIDCPDCQFQMLQQQNQGQTPDIPGTHQVHQISQEIPQSSRTSSEPSLWSETRNKPISQETVASSQNYQHGPRIQNPPSSSCLNIYSYGTEPGNFHMMGNGNPPSSAVPNHSSAGALSMTPMSTSQAMEGPQSGAPVEPCDYNGYCSTCAVLELPTSDKYYRPSNTRPPHVFPPIFYTTQGPSSVIPCFSPIPDCPWGNEYNIYGYTTPYPQPSSTPSASNEYYGSSNLSANSSSVASSEPSNMGHLQPPNSVQYSGSTSYNSSTRAECTMIPGTSVAEVREVASKTIPEPLTKPECGSKTVISIPSSSTSSSDDDTDNDSLDGSDSILSEDRELISVVEDEENHGAKESFYVGRQSSKCWVCRNPLGMSVCSSPQLAKILENIDGEIMADDLDISVSSGDIEIGGIDDEVKDFNHKKDHPASQPEISLSRLYTLTGLSPQFPRVNCERLGNSRPDSDIVYLCFKCGKIVYLADSLEQQLMAAVNKLNQQLLTSDAMLEMPLHMNQPSQSFREDRNVQVSFPIYQRPECTDKSTQMDDDMNCELSAVAGELAESKDSKKNKVQAKIYANVSEEETSSRESDADDLSSGGASSKSLPDREIILPTNPNESKHMGVQGFTNCLENNTDHSEHSNVCPLTEKLVTNDKCFPLMQRSSNDNMNETEMCNDSIIQERLSNPNFVTREPQAHAISPVLMSRGQNISLTCSYCNRKFSTKSNLTAHHIICKFTTSHTSGDFTKSDMKCSCGIGFRSMARRKLHLEQGCKSLVFKCDYCSKIFSKNSELNVHLQLHKGDKSFKCDICGASFSTKGNQVVHLRTHSATKSYPCTLCEKGFNRKYALLMHMNRHNGLKPFSCTICCKGFSDPSNLKNHIKRSHQEKRSSSESIIDA